MLAVAVNFVSFTDIDEEQTKFSDYNNMKMIINDKAVIKEFFKSLHSRHLTVWKHQ